MSTSPHFRCVSCPTTFTFDFPPVDPQLILCRAVETGENPTPVAMRKCPRCGKECAKSFQECPSCQVLFERLEGLPTDPSLRAQPSLVRRWKELLEDFENAELHEGFIEACRRLDALAFAASKYRELSQIQGGDPLCEQKLKLIDELVQKKLLATASPRPQMAKKEPVSPFAEDQQKNLSPVWMRWLLAAPILVGFLLFLVGLGGWAPRNTVGAGLSIGLLGLGVVMAVKGRLSLRDFVASKSH